MKELILCEESVAAYKELMTNPESHGLTDMKPLKDCFVEVEQATPKHVLYNQYVELIGKPLPKVIFYIVMDEIYGKLIDYTFNALGVHGDLGYKLSIVK